MRIMAPHCQDDVSGGRSWYVQKEKRGLKEVVQVLLLWRSFGKCGSWGSDIVWPSRNRLETGWGVPGRPWKEPVEVFPLVEGFQACPTMKSTQNPLGNCWFTTGVIPPGWAGSSTFVASHSHIFATQIYKPKTTSSVLGDRCHLSPSHHLCLSLSRSPFQKLIRRRVLWKWGDIFL